MMRTRLRRWGVTGAAVGLLLLALQAVTAVPALAATGKTIGSGSVPVDSGPGSGNSAVVPACPSAQFGTGTYPVAWTDGGGVQPMSAPSASSSADGGVIGDGTLVTVACETTGDTVTDSAGFTSNIREQSGGPASVSAEFAIVVAAVQQARAEGTLAPLAMDHVATAGASLTSYCHSRS